MQDRVTGTNVAAKPTELKEGHVLFTLLAQIYGEDNYQNNKMSLELSIFVEEAVLAKGRSSEVQSYPNVLMDDGEDRNVYG